MHTYMLAEPIEKGPDVTSLFVRRSVYHTFWGLHNNDGEDYWNNKIMNNANTGKDELMPDAGVKKTSQRQPEPDAEDSKIGDAPPFVINRNLRTSRRQNPRRLRKQHRQKVQKQKRTSALTTSVPDPKFALVMTNPGPSTGQVPNPSQIPHAEQALAITN